MYLSAAYKKRWMFLLVQLFSVYNAVSLMYIKIAQTKYPNQHHDTALMHDVEKWPNIRTLRCSHRKIFKVCLTIFLTLCMELLTKIIMMKSVQNFKQSLELHNMITWRHSVKLPLAEALLLQTESTIYFVRDWRYLCQAVTKAVRKG